MNLEERKWGQCLRLVNDKVMASSAASAFGEANDARSDRIFSTGTRDLRCSTVDVADTAMPAFQANTRTFHRSNSAPEPRRVSKSVSFKIRTCPASKSDISDSIDGALNISGKLYPPLLVDLDKIRRPLRRIESLDSIRSLIIRNNSHSSANEELDIGNESRLTSCHEVENKDLDLSAPVVPTQTSPRKVTFQASQPSSPATDMDNLKAKHFCNSTSSSNRNHSRLTASSVDSSRVPNASTFLLSYQTQLDRALTI